MTPPGIVLQGDAERRLETLREFTELGAGFRVAAADLEIRGAGNLLGAEQSGHMAAVGFEMYLRMLEEAVSEAKGETPVMAARCETSLGLDLSVPASYMEDVNQRLTFYRQLSLAAREKDVERVSEETQDRFGPLPEAVSRMIEAVRLRIRAERLLIRSVVVKGGLLTLRFDPAAPLDTTGLVRFLSSRRGVRLNPAGSLEVSLAPGEATLGLLAGLLDASSPAAEASA
jgi:transcription-repair coupling factor (superfamily II helicase)